MGCHGLVGGGPVLGEEFPEGGFVTAAGGEPGDEVAEVFFRIHSVVAGADEQAQEDGGAFARFGAANKHPVLATNGEGADVSFDSVVIDLDLAMIDIGAQIFSLVEKVAHSFTQTPCGASGFAITEGEAGFLKQLDERRAVSLAVEFFGFVVGLKFFEVGFDGVKFSKNFEEPLCEVGFLFECFFKFPSHVGEAGGS